MFTSEFAIVISVLHKRCFVSQTHNSKIFWFSQTTAQTNRVTHVIVNLLQVNTYIYRKRGERKNKFQIVFFFSFVEKTKQQLTKMWSFFVLKFVRASYICMNGLTQLVSGYSLSSGTSQERRDMIECYERSAHVIKIKMKRRKFELEGPDLTHFVLRHDFQKQKFPANKNAQFVWHILLLLLLLLYLVLLRLVVFEGQTLDFIWQLLLVWLLFSCW